MRRMNLLGAVGMAVALASGFAAAAHAAVDRPFPAITVSGEAEISVAPDIAETSAGVTTEAKTVREASAANTQAMTAVIAALKQAGVGDKDIQTGHISIQPVYNNTQSKKEGRPDEPRIVGYRVGNQVRLKVRDLARLGEVLDQAIAAGATDVFGVSFSVSEASKALDAARGAAVADAKRKADLFAKAAGAQVGRAIDIAEAGAAVPRQMRFAAAADRRTLAAPMPIATGENTLHVTVTITYELLN